MAYQASPQSSLNLSSCVDRKLEKEKTSTTSSLSRCHSHSASLHAHVALSRYVSARINALV